MRTTPCIELAEGHHLAWLIARFTAVRPGSIGGSAIGNLPDPHNNESFLMWKDISLSRRRSVQIILSVFIFMIANTYTSNDSQLGQFTAQITIRNLKTNHVNPAMGPTDRTLTFTLLSPKRSTNIQFSVPHRLLVMVLRRNCVGSP